MNAQPKGPTDSLELLLDTVCNCLGSMILITLLIVVSTNDLQERLGNADSKEEAEEHAQTLAMEEQIDEISRDVTRLRDLAGGLTELKAEVAMLRSKQSNTIEPSDDPVSAEAKRIEIAERTLKEAKQRVETKKAELVKLEASRQELIRSQTQEVRLPSRQTSEKRPELIFVADGKYFPQMLNGRLSAHVDIDVLRARPLYATIKPDFRRGMDLSEFTAFLATLDPGSQRVGLLVYPSGFEMFMRAQQACAKRGLECGWEPLATDAVMTIGGSGTGIQIDPQ
ncbi:MAG: hypothetical protein U1F81_02555 [Verrucomicrobiaceae bacterium]